MKKTKHFIDLDRLDEDTLRDILRLAVQFKMGKKVPGGAKPLEAKTLIMIFEKPSTRTRVSFEVGMSQLGGHAVVLSENDSQLGRGESVADTARVLSRYADAIMIRTDDPSKLEELAKYGSVPVINGLTDRSHPCQLMADVLAYEQHRGPITKRTVAWVGDGNNMANTWAQAAARLRFKLRLACPAELAVDADILAWARAEGADIIETSDPKAAVEGADLVVTDTWVSMGDSDADQRRALLSPFQVNEGLMAVADKDALFMHCLPAHRGEEVTDAVIDGPQSVVWDEAEYRLHAQKAILTWALMTV